MNNQSLNIKTLKKELNWFSEVLKTRFDIYFNKQPKYKNINEIQLPDFSNDKSIYAQFIIHYNFSILERLALILTLIPHIQPQMLDVFYTKNRNICNIMDWI